jgi:crotonobetainyl-CoA:carnitine CoA-transferase CaiB-like acyl-CoA transferase
MAQCLDDLLVIEAGSGWPIALAGRVLAELGATVVKIEPSAGDALRRAGPVHDDGTSHAWHSACAGKRSFAPNLQDGGDRETLQQLLATADIVLTDETSFDLPATGWRDRHDVILAQLTPFGASPPTTWRRGCEGVMQAAAGIIATTGFPDGAAVRAGCGLSDHVGAFYATAAILAALLHRDHSGEGQQIDIASQDALVTLLLLWLPKFFLTGQAPKRQGNRHLSSVPWNAYATADGWVMLCTSTDAQWLRLCDLMDRPDLKGGRYDKLRERMNDVDYVDGLVATWVKDQSTDALIKELHAIGVPAGRIFTIAEMLNDPHARARAIVTEVADHAGGRVKIAGPLCKMSDTPGVIAACGPALDADRSFIARCIAERRGRPSGDTVMRAPALSEITVVESGVFGAGPFATKLMAELGMTVIKLESPEGDGMRHYQPQLNGTAYPFHLYNANKRSISLNLKSPRDMARARDLLANADVYLENLAPGAIDRLGLGYREVATLNPRLVYCSVSGFGRTGPYANDRAYDTVIQAMSGIMSVTGEHAPTKIGVSAADLLGPIFACIPIFAALHHRNRGGTGQHLDVAMLDVCAATTQSLWPLAYGGNGVGPLENGHPFYAPYGSYPVRDGEVFIGIEDDQQWAALSALIGLGDDPAFGEAQGRLAQRATIDAAVSDWTRDRTAADVTESCQAAGIPAAPVRSIEAVMTDPRTAERGMLVHLRDASGSPLTLTGSPFRMSRTPGRVLRPGPALNDFVMQAAE